MGQYQDILYQPVEEDKLVPSDNEREKGASQEANNLSDTQEDDCALHEDLVDSVFTVSATKNPFGV